ncbi:helix-turn-helix domain-containing protein [Actinokineospora sp.]|uniref:helix-turn-helix domain-containing protein n=1 Tax=Actinokineospora sp. TaxID=1872133 RepID=UPI003D6A83AF
MAEWSIVAPGEDVARIDELVYAAPDPRLAGKVLTYTAHDYTHPEPISWQVIALGAVTVTIDIDRPVRLVGAESMPVSPVLGLRDRPVTITQSGHAHGITIGLSPAGAYALFGLPLSEIANAAIGLGDLVGSRACHLADQLAHTPTWAERFRIVDRHLLAWSQDGPRLARPVHGAWHRLMSSHGRVRIGALADEIGWTRQHLVSRFRGQIGLTPKTVARVARLHRATTLINDPGALSWADIAHDSGYADQSHLNRDFRDLTGSTPTQTVLNEPPTFVHAR